MIDNLHSTQSCDWPRPGSLVRDTVTGRDGRVMDYGLDRLESGGPPEQVVFLRPENGGCEWAAAPENVEPLAL
ncbi:hypothetical protein [Streptomyces sp. NPDC127105]|uniref:hypothetical protein n=1 Tax=Streptomyces sp. NPDC127105 TaxID=3345359 RepID=UPI003661C0D6